MSTNKKPSAKNKANVNSKKSVTKPKKMADKTNYKPTLYRDDNQIPKEVQGVDVGTTVNFMVTGKVISKSERSDRKGTSNSVSIEVDKIQPKTKKDKK